MESAGDLPLRAFLQKTKRRLRRLRRFGAFTNFNREVTTENLVAAGILCTFVDGKTERRATTSGHGHRSRAPYVH